MNKLMLLISAGILFTYSSCKQPEAKETPAPHIDMKLFFKNPAKAGFRISPDGQYFSYRADYKGKTNIYVQKTTDTTPVRVTNDTLRSISSYFWKGDRIVYAQDIGGDENFQVFSVKPDGSDMKALTPFPGFRSDVYDDFRFIPGKEKLMLVGINKRNKEYFDPYLLNIETGELTLLYDNKQNFDSWYPDNTGMLRMATKTDGVNITYLYRNTDKDSFQTLLTTNFKEGFYPQAFDAENKTIYVMSNLGRDKLTLVRYDPVAKKEVEELFKNNDYDLQGIDYDRKTNKLISVSWEGEKTEEHYFDKDRGDRIAELKKKFPGFDVMLTTYDDNMTKGIVWTGNDVTPAKYYLYDFATRDAKEVANAYPWLNAEDLAPMKPIQYKTRDGLTVHAYLTLPKGVAAKNLPVVINPHGGPWARDGWGYDPEVQFLANRGYAVLQMNYRGSTGYGKQFWESSFKQWGKKMQDDITDGVEYLKKEGIADPKRIAIYGGSYGGYATLAGVTFTPDLYACAVDYVGVSNLFTFMKTIPPYWKPYLDQFYEMVGSPTKDSLLLAEASPVLHVDKIKTPLFIAQGANDPRVNKAESDQMVAALKARGVDVQYMVKNNEGHGFHNEDNRFDFYGAMEQFLAKYLKPQAVAEK
ncbi:S9 family peptidase [Taibaiella soli]|uniref:S9 family peptidase n=1 Tax=Taibaiella soli TaxID=1649169 RepID=A0A2W2BUA5_9BACT|nr:S9 family peptidase [Taibaiella soli]PZF71403.1 S9 family peptidase [Taibaiella soli]